VLEDGSWSETEVGTPQGSVISPLLANIYLHYVFDLWTQHWRKHRATGDMIVVRYADDIVLGFQHRTEAERFLQEWKERLRKFGLELHPDKTRLIEFGRFARKPEAAGRGQAGDVQLPRLHPHLWTVLEDRQVPRHSQDHPQATHCKAERDTGGASTTPASAGGRSREMVEVRCAGLLQLSGGTRPFG